MDKTLLKGLQVLEYVTRSEHKVRITEVATALGLTKSNAYRLLKSLEAAGFLNQDGLEKHFGPSVKVWELGAHVISQLDFPARASGSLRRLAEQSRETVHLAVLDGADVIYIDKIDSPEPVAAYTRLGGRAPAHCVATGKALLAELQEAELAPRLSQLIGHSEFTITDPDALRAELARTRLRGYAMNHGEWRDSVWGLAAAIKDRNGASLAAIGVSGPRYRLEAPERCARLVELVCSAAREISRTAG